jgi:YVTN family beta-propeller protein
MRQQLFFKVLATSAVLLVANCSWAEPFAYSTNEKSGTVSVIDTQKDEVVGTFNAGQKPRGAAISGDGKYIFVSDQPHNALVVIDLETKAISDTIRLEASPEGVSISPDSKWIAVANEEDNSVSFIDTATRKVSY